MKQILVIGAGTGGAIVANLLARKLSAREARITVISGSRRHYYQPGWLYVPFGRQDPRKLSKPVRGLLDKRIDLITDVVADLDTGRQCVLLSDGQPVKYDYLVVATGSHPVPTDVPGLAEGGHHFYTQEAASRLFNVLQEFKGGRVVVGVGGLPYKCPPAPLEFTFLLDEFLTQQGVRKRSYITYAYPINRCFPIESVANFAQPLLDQRRIKTELMFNLEKVKPGERVAVSLEGTELDYDLLVMIPPHRGAPFLQGHPIADENGWVKTDRETLEAKSASNVWVLGDATDLPISKAGSTAHFEAPVVVERVMAAVRAKLPDPKRSKYAGHVACFMETGYNKATMLDFDYSRPPEPKAPNHVVHYLKMAFNKAYWQLVPTGVV